MELTTEEKILEAARQVFTQKGYAAARMQEIADIAGINKGLLHYYFKNKSKLFRGIFDEAFTEFVLSINAIFEADIPLLEKIEAIVDRYIDTLIANPALPGFVLNELNQNSEAFVKEILSRRAKPNLFPLIGQIQMEVQAGRIREVNPFHLVLNIMSMCVFPFIARPMFQAITEMNDPTYLQMMESRKQEITGFVFHAIRLPGS